MSKVIDTKAKVKKEPNLEKLKFMSTGSIGGMAIGSVVTYIFPSKIVLIFFIVLGIISISNMFKLNLYD